MAPRDRLGGSPGSPTSRRPARKVFCALTGLAHPSNERRDAFGSSCSCAPCHSGKTTLPRALSNGDSPHDFDREHPASLARLIQPMTALQSPRGVAVNLNDQTRSRPDRSAALRLIVDRKPLPACFLLLGSTSPFLIGASSDSPARHLQIIGGPAPSRAEVGTRWLNCHWQRGGIPLALPRSHKGQPCGVCRSFRPSWGATCRNSR